MDGWKTVDFHIAIWVDNQACHAYQPLTFGISNMCWIHMLCTGYQQNPLWKCYYLTILQLGISLGENSTLTNWNISPTSCSKNNLQMTLKKNNRSLPFFWINLMENNHQTTNQHKVHWHPPQKSAPSPPKKIKTLLHFWMFHLRNQQEVVGGLGLLLWWGWCLKRPTLVVLVRESPADALHHSGFWYGNLSR